MKTPMSAMLAVLLAGCGSSMPIASDGGTDGGTDAGSTNDAGTVRPPPLPFYEVPIDDPALAAHVFFAVPDVHYVTTDGIVTLTYDFPEQLSGIVDQEVVLSGPVDASGGATISGPVGTGTCTVEGGVVRCIEFFTALPIDAAAARAMAGTYSTSPDAIAARRAVIDRFASDPIGIVVFDLATAQEPTD